MDVADWMSKQKLKLNKDKTELIVDDTKQRLSNHLASFGSITFVGHDIAVSPAHATWVSFPISS